MDATRLQAFSDGVIAIAITLLVLELRVPGGEPHLRSLLIDLWPKYAAYALSFVVIGIIWVNHHSLFARITRITRVLLFLNLALLMGIAFLPFPTAVLGTYITAAADAETAADFYSGTMFVIAVCFSALWWYVSTHSQLLAQDVAPAAPRLALRRSLFGPIAYLIAIAAAHVEPRAALVVFAIAGTYFALAGWRPRGRAGQGAPR